MCKEELKKLYKKYERARLDYSNYVNPFFTTMWGGQIIKRATKFLNKEKITKIKELRKARKQAYIEWRETRAAY